MDLDELARALALFAALDPTAMPLHHVQLYLEVARRGHCSYAELEEELSITNSSVSRTVHALGETNRQGVQGRALLETYRSPDEGRRFEVRLTAKGRALLRALRQA